MKLAKNFVLFCPGVMLHVVVVVPRTFNVEVHFAALVFADWLEITQMLPEIHADVVSFCGSLIRALEKRARA